MVKDIGALSQFVSDNPIYISNVRCIENPKLVGMSPFLTTQEHVSLKVKQRRTFYHPCHNLSEECAVQAKNRQCHTPLKSMESVLIVLCSPIFYILLVETSSCDLSLAKWMKK